MPLVWLPDDDPRIVRFRATPPPPPLEEIEARLAELPAAVREQWQGLVLNDATEFPAPSPEYFRDIIPEFAKIARRAGIRRYAVLTRETAMYGMGRMAAHLADPVLELEAFRDEASARAWLLRE